MQPIDLDLHPLSLRPAGARAIPPPAATRHGRHRLGAARLCAAAAVALVSLSAGDAYAWHRSANLKAANGQFVVAEGGGGSAVNANRNQALSWETFTLIDHNAGQLMDGDRVSLRTVNGRFVVAEGNGGQIVRADRTEPSTWETFRIEKVSVDPSRPIADGHQIALRTDSGFYLSAQNGGGGAVDATRTARGWSEVFTLGGVGDPAPLVLSGPFTLPQAVAPTVFGVDAANTPADRPVYECTNYQGEGVPHCYRGHQGTDFSFVGSFPGMNLGSINVVAAASGRVVRTGDGNVDRCYSRVPPPPADSPPSEFVVCPGTPSGTQQPNFVAVLQDDGMIAYYFQLKRGSVAVVEDQRVSCGQLIGKVGSSGTSSAPHLHYELRRIPLATVAAGGALPGANRADFDHGNVSGLSAVTDPYLPQLWSSLAGKIPAKVCSHSTSDSTFDVGERCGDIDACGAGKFCIDDVCKITNVPPAGVCDANQLCGPGLTCSAGRCTLPCTQRCPAFPHPNNCFLDQNNACKRDVSTTIRQDCARIAGVCPFLSCFVDGGGNCKKDVPSTVRQDCAMVCFP